MDEIIAVILFVAIAATAWHVGSFVAYVMAAFIGVGELLYVMVNGFQGEAWYALAGAAGLVLVGFLRDHNPPRGRS